MNYDIWPLYDYAVDRDVMNESIEKRDGELFALAGSRNGKLEHIGWNVEFLIANEMFEKALVCAYVRCKGTNVHVSLHEIEWLFRKADRTRLRAAGQSLCQATPLKIYRGIAGSGDSRRPRGFSWTLSMDVACWFAGRGFENPAVYTATVDPEDILSYIGGPENEVLVQPKKRLNLKLTKASILAGSARALESWKSKTLMN